jgi:hypothetical protein
MLRVLIGTGLVLMTLGFGAAGWQYWKTMPKAAPAAEAAGTGVAEAGVATPAASATTRQSWLISPTGGLIAQDDVRAYLAQDRFVAGRAVWVERQARLADLLAEGEKLPDPAFLQVLADIRAPRVAEGLCDVMTSTLAEACAVNAARVVEGSVDAAAGTALFRLELVYRLKDAAAELPDLAAHVLGSSTIALELGPDPATPDAALAAALAAVTTACGTDGVGEACRPLRLDLNLAPGRAASATATIAWLDPLPKGMFVAPPLDVASGD